MERLKEKEKKDDGTPAEVEGEDMQVINFRSCKVEPRKHFLCKVVARLTFGYVNFDE